MVKRTKGVEDKTQPVEKATPEFLPMKSEFESSERLEAVKNVIFADLVMDASFGPLVSRFTLGIEVAPRKHAPVGCVVMPTTRLIEALNAMQNSLRNNPVLKPGLLAGLEQVKKTIEKA